MTMDTGWTRLIRYAKNRGFFARIKHVFNLQ